MTPILKVRQISLIVLCGIIIASLWTAYQTHFHAVYPYDTFLFRPDDRFMDFFNSYSFLKAFTYIGHELACYFPFTYWAFYPLTLLREKWSFIVYNCLFISYSYYFMASFTQNIRKIMDKLEYKQLIITTIFLSYPFIYCVDRGNLEVMVFIFLSFSILLFSREKYISSAVFLAFATGMKFYPAIFALLLIKRKRYKELALFFILTGVITLAALYSLHGGFSENLTVFLQRTKDMTSGTTMNGVRQSGSLMAVFKVLYVQISSFSHPVTFSQLRSFVDWFSPFYTIGAFILIFIFSLYILFFEHVFWKQVMILTLLMILLPALSYDYKLIHLFIPLALFLHEDNLVKTRFTKLYVIMFALLLIPKNYYIFQVAISNYWGDPADLGVSTSVFANTLIMLVFLIVIVGERKYIR